MDSIFASAPLLKYISGDELKALKHQTVIRDYKKGEVVFSPGSEPNFMYVLASGFMKISMDLLDGREQVLYIYKEGDFVGGHNLLTKEKYIYRGTCLKASKIILIHSDDFDNILKANNKVLLKILDQSFRRIRRSEELIDRLSVINADMRVAKLILDMVRLYGVAHDDKIFIKSLMSREELGSYSGIARETLSRKLSYFESLGLIKLLPRGEILVLDLEGISNILA